MSIYFSQIIFRSLSTFNIILLFGLNFAPPSQAASVEIGNTILNSTDLVPLDHNMERILFNDLSDFGILRIQGFKNVRDYLTIMAIFSNVTNISSQLKPENIVESRVLLLRGFYQAIYPFTHFEKRTKITEETLTAFTANLNPNFLRSKVVLAFSFDREEFLRNGAFDQNQAPFLQRMADQIKLGSEGPNSTFQFDDNYWIELYPVAGSSNQGNNIVLFVQTNFQSVLHWERQIILDKGSLSFPLQVLPSGQGQPTLIQAKVLSVSLFSPHDPLFNALHPHITRMPEGFTPWWLWEPLSSGLRGRRLLPKQTILNPIAIARLNQDFHFPSVLDVDFSENFFGPRNLQIKSQTSQSSASASNSSSPESLIYREKVETPISTGAAASSPSPWIKGTLLSPDGKHLFIALSDGICRIWDTETKAFLSTQFIYGSSEDANEIVHLALSPIGMSLLISGKNSVTLWDAKDGLQIHKWQNDGTQTALPVAVAFSLDSRTIAMGDLNNPNQISLFDRFTLKTQTLSGHSKPVTKLQFIRSPLSGEVLLISSSEDHTARLWNLNSLKQIHIFQKHNNAIQDFDVSEDGKQLVTASPGDSLILWDLETFEIRKRLWHARPFKTVKFAFKDRACLSTVVEKDQAGQTILWNLFDSTLEKDGLNPFHNAIFSIAPSADAFTSPTGSFLYSIDMDGIKTQRLKNSYLMPGESPTEVYKYKTGNSISIYEIPRELSNLIEGTSNRKRPRDGDEN